MSDVFKPEIVVLYCRQSVDPDADLAAAVKKADGFSPRLVAMPCSSKVEVPHLMKVLERGADGVVVLACPENECKFLVGNVRAEKRVNYARGLLDQVGMGAERLGIARGSRLSAEEAMAVAEHRANQVRLLGKNPLDK